MASIVRLSLLTIVTLACVVYGQNCPGRCSCHNGVAECSKRSLVAPPTDFPEDIRVIILDNNHLRVIGKGSFRKQPNLEVLRMKGNKVRVVKKTAFKAFPGLMTLDLSNNQLVKIYNQGFDGMDKLQTLSLQYNKLRSISRILDTTPRLFQLNLAFNNIQFISKNDLATPTRIHYLDLRGNQITKIHPEAFSNLKYLRYLFLNNNPLVKVPDMTFGSNVLQSVDFSNCKLTHVPRTMPASVTDFRLSDNEIMQINDSDFVNITDLRMLALNNNQLHFVGNRALTHLDRLEELWLRNNHLVYIPRGIPDNVRKLYMDSNMIREIEGGLFKNTSHLDYLTVENNKIQRINNNTFTGLKFLKTLNFRGNKLRVIETGTFDSLRNLSSLSLSDNPLEKIEPGAFRNLENLTFLHLSMCGERMALEQNFLPDMTQLQQLKMMNSPGLAKAFVKLLAENYTKPLEHVTEVDLTYDDIETLSPNVREVFPMLKAFYLDGNPWLCDKRLTWLKEWMTTSDISFSQYEPVICEQPYALKGREVKDVAENDFAEVAPPRQQPSAEEMSEILSRQQNAAANEASPTGNDVASNAVVSSENKVAAAFSDSKEVKVKPLKPLAMINAPVDAAADSTTSPTTKLMRRKRKNRRDKSKKKDEQGKKSGERQGKKQLRARGQTWKKGGRPKKEKPKSSPSED